MPCVEGTVCAPVGLMYELQILHAHEDHSSSSVTALPTMYGMPLVGGATFMGVHDGLAVVVFLLHCGIIAGFEQ